MTFTHLDDDQHPTMVDVGDKTATRRNAVAETRVLFPAAVAAALRDSGMRSAKGPIFDTAIIAGVMAAKRTHELIEMDGDAAWVRCAVSVHHKTGVEMEALTGASIAALTIYDMCKALSHEIVITDTRLVSKHGGRHPFTRGTEP
jgi:cyclic pyranopterin phosphate synthase